MPPEIAPVIRLHERRAKAEGTPAEDRVPLAIQAAPGAVAMFVCPPGGEPIELWLRPEQAFEIATDLFNAARDAKETDRG